MARETPCQTPDAEYHISVRVVSVDVRVDIPFFLDLNEAEARLLENNLHNAVELVLAPYFRQRFP